MARIGNPGKRLTFPNPCDSQPIPAGLSATPPTGAVRLRYAFFFIRPTKPQVRGGPARPVGITAGQSVIGGVG